MTAFLFLRQRGPANDVFQKQHGGTDPVGGDEWASTHPSFFLFLSFFFLSEEKE